MPWPLQSRRDRTWYPLGRRLGGFLGWSGFCGEKKSLLPLLGIKVRFFAHQACNEVTIMIKLYQLPDVLSKKDKAIP
jgi:hypothetical protein